ncbi:hypothetical protein MMC17_001705 [Xylographa soralifera]|nr:hypothetical protein [Xylographa soralifera]
MEVLGAVASVAGILSLAGQTLRGIMALHDFFQDCSSASKTIAKFLQELISFKQTILNVQEVVSRIEGSFEYATRVSLVSLSIQLEDVRKAMSKWLEEARKCHPHSASGTKALFKALLVALKKENFRDYLLEIERYKSNMVLGLSVLGRTLEIEQSLESKRHTLKLDEVATRTSNTEKVTVEALARLEINQELITFNDNSSNPESITSRLSRIESLLSSAHSIGPSPGSETGKASYISGRSASSLSVLRNNSPPTDGWRSYRSSSPTEYDKYMSKSAEPFLCYCCPSKPQKVYTHEELRKHQNEKVCPHCESRFQTTGERKRHLDSLPSREHSWSCAALPGHAKAYRLSPSTSGIAYTCRYCGEESILNEKEENENGSWADRIDHLKIVHRFKECNLGKKFFREYHFRQHLKHSHRAVLGQWTNDLEALCMKTELSQEQPDTVSSLNLLTTDEAKASRLSRELVGGNSSHRSIQRLGEAYRALIESSIDAFPSDIANYIRLIQLHETFRTHSNLLTSWTNPDLAQTSPGSRKWTKVQHSVTNHTQRIEAEVERARNSCWERGYNLDEIDRALRPYHPRGPKIGTSPTSEPSADTPNELAGAVHIAAHHKRAKAWSTRQDRINAWLLQNLVASPKLTQLHRSFCKDGNKLSEEDWARSVMKFWPLDEAATRGEQKNCSTNGAVNSDGACHSARVLLETGILRETTEKEGTDSDLELSSQADEIYRSVSQSP